MTRRTRRSRQRNTKYERTRRNTWFQLVLGLALLVMLIAFGSDLSTGAAGCFYKISEAPESAAPAPIKQEPNVRVKMLKPDAQSVKDTDTKTPAPN